MPWSSVKSKALTRLCRDMIDLTIFKVFFLGALAIAEASKTVSWYSWLVVWGQLRTYHRNLRLLYPYRVPNLSIQYNLRIQVTSRGPFGYKPMTKAAPTSHPHSPTITIQLMPSHYCPRTTISIQQPDAYWPMRPSHSISNRYPSLVRSILLAYPSADLCVGLHSRWACYPYLTLALLNTENEFFAVFVSLNISYDTNFSPLNTDTWYYNPARALKTHICSYQFRVSPMWMRMLIITALTVGNYVAWP